MSVMPLRLMVRILSQPRQEPKLQADLAKGLPPARTLGLNESLIRSVPSASSALYFTLPGAYCTSFIIDVVLKMWSVPSGMISGQAAIPSRKWGR